MKERIIVCLGRSWKDSLRREEERKLLLACFGFSFFWGLLAHAYGFLQDSFSHDVLNAVYADGVEVFWKMQLGRFGTVLYRRLIRLPLALPWLNGLLSLVWIALALFLIANLFELRSRPALFVTAGVLTVNLSVIVMTATYGYEMDMNMFALLAAAAAVYCWARFGWLGTLLGAGLIAGTLSLYQSYLSVAIGLLMLFCLQRLLRRESFRQVFFPGLRSLVMLGLGGGLYYALLKLMARVKDIPLDTGSYNSVYTALEPGAEAPGLWQTLQAVYRDFAGSFLNPAASHLSAGTLRLNWLLLALTVLALLWVLLREKRGWAEKLLLLALVLLLPLGLNAARLFSGEDVHDLMKYAFWMAYLLPLLLIGESTLQGPGERSVPGIAATLLLLLLLWGNVQTANAVYVKKDLEQEATLSLMTRVLGRIEAEPDYVPGETPLVFVGADQTLYPQIYGFEAYYDITGAEYPSAVPYSECFYYYNAYKAYFRYVLNTRAEMADTAIWQALQSDERVQAMPAYPAQGCLKDVDGVLVVKLGEPIDWSAKQ